MHISSLPGQYGIGSFRSINASLVDLLVRTKQRYWQILQQYNLIAGLIPILLSFLLGNTHLLFQSFDWTGFVDEADLKGWTLVKITQVD